MSIKESNDEHATLPRATDSTNAVCACGCELTFVRKKLPVKDVKLDPRLQMRLALDQTAIGDYADHYRRAKGGQLREGEAPYDLVDVVDVADTGPVVVHGFHRRNGMNGAEMADDEFDFRVSSGTIAQAAMHAARANRTASSVRYTSLDKENACRRLWAILGKVSLRIVGDLAGVSPETAKKHQPVEFVGQPSKGKDDVVRKPPVRKPPVTVQTGQLRPTGGDSTSISPVTTPGPAVAGTPAATASPTSPHAAATSDHPTPAVTSIATARMDVPVAAPLATVSATLMVSAKSSELGQGCGTESGPIVCVAEASELPTAVDAPAPTYRYPEHSPWFAWIVEGGRVVGIRLVLPLSPDELTSAAQVVQSPAMAPEPTIVEPPVAAMTTPSQIATPSTGPGARGRNVSKDKVVLLRKRTLAFLKKTQQPQRALVRGGVFVSDQAAQQFLAGSKGLSEPRAAALEVFLRRA